MSDPEVDRKIVTITVVAAPVPSGAIAGITYWDPNAGLWSMSPPVGAKVGQQIGVAVYGQNTATFNENLRLDNQVTSPDGSKGAVATGQVVGPVAPGGAASWSILFPAQAVGAYKIELILYAELV